MSDHVHVHLILLLSESDQDSFDTRLLCLKSLDTDRRTVISDRTDCSKFHKIYKDYKLLNAIMENKAARLLMFRLWSLLVLENNLHSQKTVTLNLCFNFSQ